MSEAVMVMTAIATVIMLMVGPVILVVITLAVIVVVTHGGTLARFAPTGKAHPQKRPILGRPN
jgi:hypothetical protein